MPSSYALDLTKQVQQLFKFTAAVMKQMQLIDSNYTRGVPKVCI